MDAGVAAPPNHMGRVAITRSSAAFPSKISTTWTARAESKAPGSFDMAM